MQNNRRTDEEIINDIIEAFKNVLKTLDNRKQIRDYLGETKPNRLNYFSDEQLAPFINKIKSNKNAMTKIMEFKNKYPDLSTVRKKLKNYYQTILKDQQPNYIKDNYINIALKLIQLNEKENNSGLIIKFLRGANKIYKKEKDSGWFISKTFLIFLIIYVLYVILQYASIVYNYFLSGHENGEELNAEVEAYYETFGENDTYPLTTSYSSTKYFKSGDFTFINETAYAAFLQMAFSFGMSSMSNLFNTSLSITNETLTIELENEGNTDIIDFQTDVMINIYKNLSEDDRKKLKFDSEDLLESDLQKLVEGDKTSSQFNYRELSHFHRKIAGIKTQIRNDTFRQQNLQNYDNFNFFPSDIMSQVELNNLTENILSEPNKFSDSAIFRNKILELYRKIYPNKSIRESDITRYVTEIYNYVNIANRNRSPLGFGYLSFLGFGYVDSNHQLIINEFIKLLKLAKQIKLNYEENRQNTRIKLLDAEKQISNQLKKTEQNLKLENNTVLRELIGAFRKLKTYTNFDAKRFGQIVSNFTSQKTTARQTLNLFLQNLNDEALKNPDEINKVSNKVSSLVDIFEKDKNKIQNSGRVAEIL